MIQDTEPRLRPSWLLLGPAFVAAIAYVDPGNVAANVSAGAQYGFLLVWVIIVANAMAWIVAVTASYVMNTTITFAAESGRSLGFGRYLGFALSQFAGFLANTATVWCLVELAHIPAWAGKVVAIGVSFVVNFSLSHFVVFRARRPRESAE